MDLKNHSPGEENGSWLINACLEHIQLAEWNIDAVEDDLADLNDAIDDGVVKPESNRMWTGFMAKLEIFAAEVIKNTRFRNVDRGEICREIGNLFLSCGNSDRAGYYHDLMRKLRSQCDWSEHDDDVLLLNRKQPDHSEQSSREGNDMPDEKLIDLSSFLFKRLAPSNVNYVTDNDIKIAIICAVAESGEKQVWYNFLWDLAAPYLKIEKTDDNRKAFYLRANAVASRLVDDKVVTIEQSDNRWLIRLKPQYMAALRNAVDLYEECVPANMPDTSQTTLQVRNEALSKKMELVSAGFQIPESAWAEQPVPKCGIQSSNPVPETSLAEKESSVPFEIRKASYLKWIDMNIEYAYEQKRKYEIEMRFYASYEWGATKSALEDAKKEFLRLFSDKK